MTTDAGIKASPCAGLGRKHVGAHAELIACAWLLRHGYEVFRNVSPHGSIDVVAIKNGDVKFYDIKTVATFKQPNGTVFVSATKTSKNSDDGVELLWVSHDGRCFTDFDEMFEALTGRKHVPFAELIAARKAAGIKGPGGRKPSKHLWQKPGNQSK